MLEEVTIAGPRIGKTPSRGWAAAAIVGTVYFLSARLGTALHIAPTQIAIAWPAAGIALAALLLLKPRQWPASALAIGVANLIANLAVGSSPFTALFASVADVLEAVGGAMLMRAWVGRKIDMSQLRHVLGLAGVVALVSPLCALLGAAVTPLAAGSTFLEGWRQWWIVDGLGIVILTPAIVSCARLFSRRPAVIGWSRVLEFALLMVTTALVTSLAITADMQSLASVWSLRYLVFPFLLWGALRFGAPGAAVTALITSTSAIVAAIVSTEVLDRTALADTVLALQVFICVANLSAVGVAALDSNRRRASLSLIAANRKLRSRQAELTQEVRMRRESEARFAGLKDDLADVIDSMPLMLIAVDPANIVTQWNTQAEVTMGMPAADAIGRPAALLLDEYWPLVESSRVKQARGETAIERILVERGGERRIYELTFYPLTRGYMQGGVVMIGDATEQSRIQEVIIQTEKMISVGGLAAGMAHEINNPIGIITQAAQNIQRRVSPELPANHAAAAAAGIPLDGMQRYFEQRGILVFIQDIRAAATRAANIVGNMLEFSRRSESTKQQINLADVLERTLALAASDFDLRKRYDFRAIAIVRNYATEMPSISGVAIELEQVFLNLVKNAAQAIRTAPLTEEAPRITLTLRREEKYAVVTVQDNGPGMDDNTRRRVFEPFFTTKEPGVGTGLGLSVSFAIVTQNHKGLLSVESAPGAGAAFTVRLPLAAEAL